MLCSYVPLLVTPLFMYSMAAHPGEVFLDRAARFLWSYLVFAGAVNVAAIIVFHCQRASSLTRELRRFLRVMELILGRLTGLLIFAFFVVDPAWCAPDLPSETETNIAAGAADSG